MKNKPKYQNYRTCKTLEGETVYELNKYCKCEKCSRRLKYDRKPSNRICITVKYLSDIDSASKIIEEWSCKESDMQLEPFFMKL